MSPASVVAQETIFDPENPGIEAQDDEREPSDPTEDESEPEPAQAQDQDERSPTSGFERTEFQLDYEVAALVDPGWGPTGRDALELVSTVGMGLDYDLSERTGAVVSGRFQYWSAAGRDLDEWRTHYEPRLHRAYLIHRRDDWSLSVGQMRNRWGSTDIIRPGDVIDPVDMRDPRGADGLGTGMGQLSAAATYGIGDWTIRAVVVPFFEPNRVSLFGRDSAIAHRRNPVVNEQLPFLLLAEELLHPSVHEDAQPFLQATQRPRDLPKNISAGMRVTTTVGGTDLGLGYFFGWDRTPEVILDEDLRSLLTLIAEDGQIFEDYDFFGFATRNPEALEHSQNLSEKAEAGETIFGSRFRRKSTFLAEFARYIGPIGVRSDVAFSPRRTLYTTEFEPVRRAVVFSALGLSYERLLNGERPLALTIEGFWFHPFGADSPVHRALVPEGEGGDDGDELLFFEDGYYGVAQAVNWATGWWDVEIMAGGMASISPGDFIGQVSLQRLWRPGLRTTIGTNLFIGPDPAEQLSAGGLWAHNDRVYVALSGEF